MAERTYPSFLQNAGANHTAENTRLALSAEVLTGGIVNPADLAVTAPGGTMTVSVAVGQGWVLGSRALQGAYHVINDLAKTVTIAASDPTNPRYDRIVCEVKDSAYAGAVNAFQINVVQGTPAASPAEPALPADSFELARVLVGAAVTTINSGNILDRRVRSVMRGSVFSSAAAADVTLAVRAITSQTGDLFQWQNSAGTALAYVSAAGNIVGSNGVTASSGGAFNLAGFFTGTVPGAQVVVVKGAALQSAALHEWQSSAGGVLASVSAAGAVAAYFAANTATRTLELGAADSGGAGYRTVRVLN